MNSSSLGGLYKHINARLSHKSGIAPIQSVDGSFCISDVDKAEVFSNYFAELGIVDDAKLINEISVCGIDANFNECNLSNGVPSRVDKSNNNPASLDHVPINRSFNNYVRDGFVFNYNNTYNAILGLNSKSAAGADNISPVLFVKLVNSLAGPLSSIF